MDLNKDPKPICLHDPEHEVPGPIQDFNSLPVTSKKLRDFFRQICAEEPWKIHSNVFEETEDLVKIKKIITAVCGTAKSPPRFAGRSFAIRIKVDQLEILKDGMIPSEADLTGQEGLEAIFGKPVAIGRYKWCDVVRELESLNPGRTR
jgi:hypothetical protein